jgi:hypothetical protein
VYVYEPLLELESRGEAGPGGPEMVRREAVVLEREKKRRVDDVRLGGTKLVAAGDNGGVLGPRRSFRRFSARSHSVHGCVCTSPTWPHPLNCV